MFRLKGTEETFLKANLAIYANDTLIVTGTSYFLWTMDNFKVKTIILLASTKMS